MDLFGAAAEDELRSRGPLAARLRPRSIDDIVGQEHLFGPGQPLRRLVEEDRIHSLILWGPPGTGKTSIAMAISESTSSAFESLSAVSAGVKDVRDTIERARFRLGSERRRTILFLDEIHRFSKSQQDALLPAVEDGSIVLIGATTENPSFQITSALMSRSVLFRLRPLDAGAIRSLLHKGCSSLGCKIDESAIEEIIRQSNGDGRRVMTLLEIASVMAPGDSISLENVEQAAGTAALRFGIDDHYDIVSAFIKSLRGSDPQAAILYLARLLAAGEDPRFIARRMMIFASEDVGMADPSGLTVAVAAAQALELVGLPEAQLNLAQAAIHLATASKSNAIAQAIWTARADVESGLSFEVPEHLRDGHYPGAGGIGHGVGYVNPHSEPERALSQTYLPRDLSRRRWYEPTDAGFEKEIQARMSKDTSVREEKEQR